jgi:two-component system, NtrC family, response regulator
MEPSPTEPSVDQDKPVLLIVEDDPGLQKQLRWCFDGWNVVIAENRTEAIARLRRYEPAVVLQDLGLPPDTDGVNEGFATLREILELAPRTKVIVVTGNHDRVNAVKAVSLGAYDFCAKPVEPDVLTLIVERARHIYQLEDENRRLQERRTDRPLEGIIATDEAMLKVCRTIEKVAPATIAVLILGESGTGKELLARAVHFLSNRRERRFVAINCAAIPDSLLESELFGYEKGAFTGAAKQTIGKIEHADGGTLFLDEVGDMPLSLQAKLLRFLQDKVIERLGGRQEISVDVRIVCATNRDLQAMIAAHQFREDLYYRISEVTVRVPPLRERPGGATVLAHAMLRNYASAAGQPRRDFSAEALVAIEGYSWPGNVRELENKVKAAVILADDRFITAEHLGLPTTHSGAQFLNLREVRARAERQALRQALAVADGNVSAAADLLGVSRPTLYDLIERYGRRDGGS